MQEDWIFIVRLLLIGKCRDQKINIIKLWKIFKKPLNSKF